MQIESNNATRKDRRDARTFDRKAARRAKARDTARLDRRATTRNQRAALYLDGTY